jgi:hypothetical protein
MIPDGEVPHLGNPISYNKPRHLNGTMLRHSHQHSMETGYHIPTFLVQP